MEPIPELQFRGTSDAYHGTGAAQAVSIEREGFRMKSGGECGRGHYFFEQNEVAAWTWAVTYSQKPPPHAVVHAQVEKGWCLTLTNEVWDEVQYLMECVEKDSGGRLRQNEAVRYVIDIYEQHTGRAVDTVRRWRAFGPRRRRVCVLCVRTADCIGQIRTKCKRGGSWGQWQTN